jgi:hypothetical protein
MGCLFALFAGLFPRLALFIIWVARSALVDAAFHTFVLPLLGIIFLPFATLISRSQGCRAGESYMGPDVRPSGNRRYEGISLPEVGPLKERSR